MQFRFLGTLIISIFCFGCAKQNHKILASKSSIDFTTQEYCYINNKIVSYIMETNDMFVDIQKFSYMEFDKINSSILYQKMNDSILKANLKYVIDTMDNPPVKQIKNRIDVLKFCNSTQMSALHVDMNNKSDEYQLSATSKYKCHFSISDIVQVKDKYYVFCEFSEYINIVDEIEKSILGFQFRICQINNFIKFEHFLEWRSEMFGYPGVKLFTTKNDSIILNDTTKSTRFYQEAGFFITKIKSFECD